MAQPKTVPLICGAVYERRDPRSAMPERMVITSTKVTVGGSLQGEGRLIGDAEWREFTEGDESMTGWSLVAEPVALKEPISSENLVETETASLKRQLAANQLYTAQLERDIKKASLTDEQLVALVEKGTRWGEIGKPYNMGWQEVKNRWDTLVREGQQAQSGQTAKSAARYARVAAEAKGRAKAAKALGQETPSAPAE